MKHTPLYNLHVKSGAKMVPFAGFEMPVQYEGINSEHLAVREAAGMFDVSHMGNFFITGTDAAKYLQYLTSNDIAKLYPGKVQYSTLTNVQGGIVDDLLVYMLDENHYMLVVNAANIEKDLKHLQSFLSKFDDVRLEDRSGEYAIIAVQGPGSVELMNEVTGEALEKMKFYTHRELEIAGIPVLLSTTGYTGEKGFEIYLSAADAPSVWNRVAQVGLAYDLKFCGLGARDTLRLEKGYCLYGNDINDKTTPLEAGLGWITKLETGFLGSDVLKRQKEEGLARRLTGFVMKQKAIPRHGYKIIDAKGNVLGEVTSGTMSPVLKQGIGMGYIPPAYSQPGNEIFILVRNKPIPAETVKLPFV